MPWRGPGPVSGQGEEKLLQLLLGYRGTILTRKALPHPAGHDLEAGPVERPGHRGELGDHVLAVPPVLDHRDDPGQLALGTAEPVEHRASSLLIELHQQVLPSTAKDTLWGIRAVGSGG